MKKNFNQAQNRPNFVPFITAEGIPASIKQTDIPEEKWIHCHGETAAGKQVNSIQMQEIGKSLMVRGNSGPTLSVTKAEAEVFAVKLLTGIGYTMKAPAPAGN